MGGCTCLLAFSCFFDHRYFPCLCKIQCCVCVPCVFVVLIFVIYVNNYICFNQWENACQRCIRHISGFRENS